MHARAEPGECLRNGAAEAGARRGHDDDAIVKTNFHAPILLCGQTQARLKRAFDRAGQADNVQAPE
jgi:hypothetical protein